MKGAVLEESNMAGVNLRVGTLKYANLQNCTLRYILDILCLFSFHLNMYSIIKCNRGAVLAGADLEVLLAVSMFIQVAIGFKC
jgi:uncharacterized protein YjbI with pentapeptide repeats